MAAGAQAHEQDHEWRCSEIGHGALTTTVITICALPLFAIVPIVQIPLLLTNVPFAVLALTNCRRGGSGMVTATPNARAAVLFVAVTVTVIVSPSAGAGL